jgi:predicted nucleic acid-binding protein
LEARPDKAWSLVDCSSFAIMQQQNISHALTSDHHFEQAGFIRLLK